MKLENFAGALMVAGIGILAVGLLLWGNFEGTDGWPAGPRLAYDVGRVVVWTAITLIWAVIIRDWRRKRRALPR